MVQLSSKVMFARIPDASCTHSRCVSHAFWTRLKKKGVEVNESLAAALLQGFALARMHLVHVPDLSHMYSRQVSLDAYCMRFRCM